MKFPIIIKSDTLLSVLSPFRKIRGLTLFPFIIVSKSTYRRHIILNRQKIAYKQQKECAVIPYAILYSLSFLVLSAYYKDFTKGRNDIPFVREADNHEKNFSWLSIRSKYHFLKYF